MKQMMKRCLLVLTAILFCLYLFVKYYPIFPPMGADFMGVGVEKCMKNTHCTTLLIRAVTQDNEPIDKFKLQIKSDDFEQTMISKRSKIRLFINDELSEKEIHITLYAYDDKQESISIILSPEGEADIELIFRIK